MGINRIDKIIGLLSLIPPIFTFVALAYAFTHSLNLPGPLFDFFIPKATIGSGAIFSILFIIFSVKVFYEKKSLTEGEIYTFVFVGLLWTFVLLSEFISL